MLDHISLRVQDFPRAVAFYRAALAPIGYDVLMEFPDAAGLGAGGKADLWIMKADEQLNPTHLAFASDRSCVEAFHAAALAAGATDNGPPGLRADYHPHYYAAYVRDPEGNNVEVVCHIDPAAAEVESTGSSAKRGARKLVKRVAAKPASRRTAKKVVAKARPATRAVAKKAPKAQAKGKVKTKPTRRR